MASVLVDTVIQHLDQSSQLAPSTIRLYLIDRLPRSTRAERAELYALGERYLIQQNTITREAAKLVLTELLMYHLSK